MSPTTAGTSKLYEPIDVEATLSKMTVSEKVQVTAGEDFWHFKGIERLGVPSPRCSDGPNGVRGQTIFNGCSSSCFPGGTAFGAMFDKELIYRIAAALGDECKAKGVHFLLGPTVNMQRHPFGGRAFESIAEDSHLSGAMAASYLQGLQSTGVGGCIKHLVANDQEHDRFASDSRISERALREIYLEPFRIAIKDGKPASLMTAYNKVNGQHASSSTHLLKTILRDEWQYDGIVMSDWSGIYALRESYEATLDVEMPGPAVVRGLPQVLRAINGNDVSPSKHLDPIVRRYLNFCNRAIASGIPFNVPETTLDTPEIRALLRECAAESIVLLKNDAKLLPLGQASFGKNKRQIALLGNNANKGLGLGGGSSSLLTTYTVSPLEALTESASKLNVDVKFAIGAPTHVLLPIIDPDMTLPDGSGKKALLVELFADEPPVADWLTSSKIAIPASKVPALRVPSNSASVMFWDGLPGDLMSHKVFGKITMNWTAPESGDWEFGVASIGYTTLFVEDELIVEINLETFVQGETFYGFASEERKGLVRGVEAGRTYRLELRLSPSLEMESMPWTTAGAARIGAFRVQTPQEALDEAVALAAESDVAVVVVGLSPEYESEGFDRKTLSLPGDSDKLIEAVLAVQPNTVVVNQSGTPVAMPWIAKASTVIHAFYAGNESGNGLADILFGARNPSAKLPISFPIRQSDILADTSFAEKSESAHAVLYNEGVMVGYRNYEKRRMEVLFPFGHGLSYATFTYSDLEVHAFNGATNGIYADVTVQVRNDGEVAGSEAVQLYVAPKSSRISRPVKELKAFAKLALAPGESKTASFRLEKEAFSYFDEDENCWIAEAVEYHILVGSSSADIRAKGQYQLEEEVRWTGL